MYRVYKSEEYYGRNIEYTGKLVLTCTECGYVGTYDTASELDDARLEHEKLHRRRINYMKVLMIGTSSCTKCKQMYPVLDKYCQDHSIEFEYTNLVDASPDVVNLIREKHIQKAPVFLIYKESESYIVSGDEIFVELESL